ncbi:MAG: GrpB family protein [Pseudomonadota bacterium]
MKETFRLSSLDPEILRAEQIALLDELRTLTGFAAIKAVGSTAVPGLIGKGDLDFAMGADRREVSTLAAALDRCFERDDTRQSNEDFIYYRVPSEYDATLLLYVLGSAYDVFDPFLKRMQADPDLRSSYNALKREWDGKPMDAYREAKAKLLGSLIFSHH